MNLDLFNNLINNIKESDTIKKFINELTDYLKNSKNETDNQEQAKNIDERHNLREENCLYQVVDLSKDGVYLQKMNDRIIFEETNISKELKDKIGNDYILRYKDGTYIFEEELTDDFFNNLIDINEYKRKWENRWK